MSEDVMRKIVGFVVFVIVYGAAVMLARTFMKTWDIGWVMLWGYITISFGSFVEKIIHGEI
jgi:hypothetical protein